MKTRKDPLGLEGLIDQLMEMKPVKHKTSYDGKPVPKEVCAYCLTHESVGHKPGCPRPKGE